jgi:hypothetical protein
MAAERGDKTPKNDVSASADGAKKEGSAIVPGSDPVPREVADAMRAEQNSQVNVNVLLVTVVEKSQSVDETLRATEQVMKFAREFENQRLEIFKARAEAIIDVKRRDPDEIEKRRNNRTRRHLKYGLTVCGMGALAGGVAIALAGGSFVAAALLFVVGGSILPMLGPLASGESVSSNDVVRIVNAVSNLLPSAPTTEPEDSKKKGRK